MKYKTIVSTSACIDDKVNAALADGWQLYGSPSYDGHFHSQCLIKPDPKIPPKPPSIGISD